jgi:hypothetical protein
VSPADPQTEPLDGLAGSHEPKRSNGPLPPVDERILPAAVGGPFSHTEYHFTTGQPSGEIAPIRDEAGNTILSYRSFAGVVGIIAALVSGIIACAGIASVLFLFAEGSAVRAAAALILTVAFTFLITLLVPRVAVTLFDGAQPALTLTQRSIAPAATFAVTTPNGAQLADIRKSFLSRLGRHRWMILQDGRLIAEAVEESLGRALVRKLLGKFSRRFETDVVVTHGGIEVARIVRRRREDGKVDVLEVLRDALDRRVLVALATVVLGREP